MSVLYPLIQALVLFAVAPLLSGITRVARARLHNRRGPGVLQEYRDIIKLLGRQSVGPDADEFQRRVMLPAAAAGKAPVQIRIYFLGNFRHFHRNLPHLRPRIRETAKTRPSAR